MDSRIMIAAALIFLSACTLAPSGVDRSPAAFDPATIEGTWAGTITSHEMVSAHGIVEAPARLTITPDGRFTLTSSGGSVATGSARPTGKGVLLEGRMTAGDPMAVGREVSFLLKPRGSTALFGEGQSFYLGHRIDSEILLRRQSA